MTATDFKMAHPAHPHETPASHHAARGPRARAAAATLQLQARRRTKPPGLSSRGSHGKPGAGIPRAYCGG
eukprot:COSAG01_NODE_38264_length_491_cov_46.349490_1_plen_69_part_10